MVHGGARMIYVGKHNGMHTRSQDEIHTLLLAFSGGWVGSSQREWTATSATGSPPHTAVPPFVRRVGPLLWLHDTWPCGLWAGGGADWPCGLWAGGDATWPCGLGAGGDATWPCGLWDGGGATWP